MSIVSLGYLMAISHNHLHPTTFECVDAEPEYIRVTEGNAEGSRLSFVKTGCSGTGSTVHCPPYKADKQLTCVVCTK